MPKMQLNVATHLVFAECCWFATSAVFDVHYGTSAVLVAAATSVLPDADYPRSWLGYQLGSLSEDLHRLFGHRSFLHSLLALALATCLLGFPLWWTVDSSSPMLRLRRLRIAPLRRHDDVGGRPALLALSLDSRVSRQGRIPRRIGGQLRASIRGHRPGLRLAFLPGLQGRLRRPDLPPRRRRPALRQSNEGNGRRHHHGRDPGK